MWRRSPVRPPPDFPGMKPPARGCAIAFPFIGKNARAAERRRDYLASNDQDAFTALAGTPSDHENTGRCSETHRNARFSAPVIHWLAGHGGGNNNRIIDLLFYTRMFYF